jgi:hypothetical protein
MAARKPVASAARSAPARATPTQATRRTPKPAPKPVARATPARAKPVRRVATTRAKQPTPHENNVRADLPDNVALEVASLRLDAYALLADKAPTARTEQEEALLLTRARLLADWALYSPHSTAESEAAN